MSLERTDLPDDPKQQTATFRNGSPTYGKIHLLDLPRCGAKLRGRDARCRGMAMANGRCRLHGGTSTGARTEEGKKRSQAGNLKHGFYTAEAIAERQKMRELRREFRASMKGMGL